MLNCEKQGIEEGMVNDYGAASPRAQAEPAVICLHEDKRDGFGNSTGYKAAPLTCTPPQTQRDEEEMYGKGAPRQAPSAGNGLPMHLHGDHGATIPQPHNQSGTSSATQPASPTLKELLDQIAKDNAHIQEQQTNPENQPAPVSPKPAQAIPTVPTRTMT